MSQIILYNYFRSSASYRVRLALGFKDLEYEYRSVHLVKDGGAQHTEDYLRLNPMGEVPYFVQMQSGQPVASLSQSMAILFYLDHLQPLPRLFPDDPVLMGRVVQMCENINSGIQPLHNLKVLKKLTEEFAATNDQKDEWVKYWITRGLRAVEKGLEPSAGLCCFGDEITAADCILIPQIFSARRFKIDMELFPVLSRIDLHLSKLDWVRAAHPSVQPDYSP